jgi:ribosome maturation factor RimP
MMATRDSQTAEALRAVIEPLGYELVEVEWSGSGPRRSLRVRIDRFGGSDPGAGVTTDDCRRVSRAVEEAGVTAEGEGLEVSSPGVERPLWFPEHWRRYVGRRVRLKAAGVSGTVTAQIAAVPDDEHVAVVIGQEHRTLPLDTVRRATLVVDWTAIGSTGKQEKH